MRIKQIKLENFHGWKDKVVTFSPHFNLVVGDNGSGKSSILDGLSIAIGSWLLGIGGIDSRHIREDEIYLKQIRAGGKVNFEPQFPVSIEATGEVFGQELTWLRDIAKRGGKTRWSKAREIKGLADRAEEEVSKGEAVELPLLAYYGTGRRWLEPKETQNLFTTRLDGYRYSIDPRISVKVLTEWLKSQEFEAWQEGESNPLYTAVTDAMKACIEGCEEIRYFEKLKSVIVKLEGGDFLPFEQLSDGQKTMLAMVGDIAMKAALLNPHHGAEAIAKTQGVVLIDEIDLHLHPKWQRRVIDDLRSTFKNIQFVATTHSTFMIQSIRDGELINLNPAKSQAEYADKSIEDIAEEVMDVEVPQRSQHYLDMECAAKEYFGLLERGKNADANELAEIKAKLDSFSHLYDAADPAFSAWYAFLERKRLASGINEKS